MKHLKLFEEYGEEKSFKAKKLLISLGAYGQVYVVLVETVEAPYGKSKDLIVFRASDDDSKSVFLETLMKGHESDPSDLENTPHGDSLKEFIESVLQDSFFTGMGASFAGRVVGTYDSPKDFENSSLPLFREEWGERKYIQQGVKDLRKAEEFLTDILGSSEAQRIMDKA